MRRLIGIALLGFAIFQLGFRGMQRLRTDVPLWDFASVYSSSRAFLHGHNPYDMPAVVHTWREQGMFPDRSVGIWTAVYPPCSLLVIAPFAMLPARLAMFAWLALLSGLLAAQFVALVDLARLKWRDPRTLILIGAALASAPLQFGILSGQLSLPAISLCIIAFWCVSKQRDKLAGVLIGLACVLKPQVASPFIIYYFARKRRDVSDCALLVGGGLCLISLFAMQWLHIDWLNGWTRSMADSGTVGNVNDYSFAGKFRDEMIDLKMLLVNLPAGAIIVRATIECIVIALLGWMIRSFASLRVRSNNAELLTLASISAILLLPIYHRVYDATLLTIALAWALSELNGKWRTFAMAALVPMCALLIPFDLVISIGYRVPKLLAIAQTAWWQSLVAPHYAWGLLGLTIALLLTLSKQAADQTVGSAHLNIELPMRASQPTPVFDDDESEVPAH